MEDSLISKGSNDMPPISAQDLEALCASQSQDTLTTQIRLHILCVARYEYLMHAREVFAMYEHPPQGIDDDIMRAFDSQAWPAIDRRIAQRTRLSDLLQG